jgi:hypothetical protein
VPSIIFVFSEMCYPVVVPGKLFGISVKVVRQGEVCQGEVCPDEVRQGKAYWAF